MNWWKIHEYGGESELKKELTGIVLDSEENIKRAILRVYYGKALAQPIKNIENLSEMNYKLIMKNKPIGYFREKEKARTYATNILDNKNTLIKKI